MTGPALRVATPFAEVCVQSYECQRVGHMVLLLERFPGGTFPLCVVEIPSAATLTHSRWTCLSAPLSEESATSFSRPRVSWLAGSVYGFKCVFVCFFLFILLFLFASSHSDSDFSFIVFANHEQNVCSSTAEGSHQSHVGPFMNVQKA